MTIFNNIKIPLDSKRKPKSFSSYFDEDIRIFSVGNIPRPLRIEAAAIIKEKGSGRSFDLAYLDSLDLEEAGRECVEKVLHYFMGCASNFMRDASIFPCRPWRLALFIVPDTEFNANVKISADQYENTAFIFINFGVLLKLCDRFNAICCDGSFLPEFDQKNEEGKAPSGRSGWIASVPLSESRKQLASHLALISATNILFHELAHFFRGHLSYLRSCKETFSELSEADVIRAADELPFNERRLLELDADQFAGRLASYFWRIGKFPVLGKGEDSEKWFYPLFVISANMTYLLMDEIPLTERYYSPLWRAQLFLDYFSKDHVLSGDARNFKEVWNDVLDFEFDVRAHFLKACLSIGWVDDFSFERFSSETSTLLGAEDHAYQKMVERISPYMPDVYFFKR